MSRTWTEVPTILVVAFVLTSFAAAQGGPPLPDGVSIGSLLAEGGDLMRLASRPDEEFELKTFVGDAGRAEQRGQRTEYVLAECDGGGAVVGLWLADLRGQLRVYVDGSALPVVDVEAATALTGELTLFPPLTAGRTATGGRLIYPLPFKRSVKVTYSRACAFEVTCRKYAESMAVHSYDPNTAVMNFFTARAALAGWKNMALPEEAELVRGRFVLEPATTEIRLDPKKSTVVYEKKTDSPRAIIRFAVERVGERAPAVTWERVRLRATFDGVTTVDVSLADLLGEGTSIGAEPARLAASCSRAGGTVHWSGTCLPMPYRESVRLEIVHDSIRPGGTLRLHVGEAAFDWNESSLHLHARTATGIGTPSLAVSGDGVLVGLALRHAPLEGERLRLRGGGDECVVATGRHFFRENPSAAAHDSSLVRVGPGRAIRWRILDRLPFRGGLRIESERSGTKAEAASRAAWTATAFWYALPQKTK